MTLQRCDENNSLTSKINLDIKKEFRIRAGAFFIIKFKFGGKRDKNKTVDLSKHKI